MFFWISFVCCFVVLSPCIQAKKESELTVLGGEDVAAGDLDFVVSLFIRQRNSQTGVSCSGSIISSQWILTAAHCLEGTSPATHVVDVYVGTKTSFQGTRIRASNWQNHERYAELSNPLRVYYDIALVKLSSSATRVVGTTVAKLPQFNEAAPVEGSTVTIAGYGIEGEERLAKPKRGVLKKAFMRVRGICANTLPYCIRATLVNGRSCNGDSGGPMIFNDKVVGVSSTGTICSTTNGDAQYTQVSPFITWINNVISVL